MMLFPKSQIESAAAAVSGYANIEVTYNKGDILVITETSQALNEFEAQLAAQNTEWDGEDVNGRILLDTLVNIQGVRTELRTRYNGEWQGRYAIDLATE
jgi:hypothetical protein